jgi:RNA polymerase sigma factor (sigma-70 family)
MDAGENAELLGRAAKGDEAAWQALVDEYSGLVHGIVRRCRLRPEQAQDAVQTTWLRLVEHLGDIREPAALPGWLRTTAFRAALEASSQARREDPMEPLGDGRTTTRVLAQEPDRPETALLLDDRQQLLRRALTTLSARDQRLLQLLVSPAQPSYEQIGATLGMPVGSIGPTRVRLLRRLRQSLEAADLHDLALG